MVDFKRAPLEMIVRKINRAINAGQAHTCKHGHKDCSNCPGGPCLDETLATLQGLRIPTRQEEIDADPGLSEAECEDSNDAWRRILSARAELESASETFYRLRLTEWGAVLKACVDTITNLDNGNYD